MRLTALVSLLSLLALVVLAVKFLHVVGHLLGVN